MSCRTRPCRDSSRSWGPTAPPDLRGRAAHARAAWIRPWRLLAPGASAVVTWSADQPSRDRATEDGLPMEHLPTARRGPAHRRPTEGPGPVRRRRRAVAVLATLALATILVMAGGLMGTVTHLEGNLATAPLRDGREPAPHMSEGAKDVLLIGSDSRDLDDGDYGQGDGSRRSDALVLVHLSAADDRIDAVQLPRDTLMDLPARPDTGDGAFRGGRGMLNSALNFGPAC